LPESDHRGYETRAFDGILQMSDTQMPVALFSTNLGIKKLSASVLTLE